MTEVLFRFILHFLSLFIGYYAQKQVTLRAETSVLTTLLRNMRLIKVFIFTILLSALLPAQAQEVTALDISFSTTSENDFTLNHRPGQQFPLLDLVERGGQETFVISGFDVVTSNKMSKVSLLCTYIDEDTQQTVKNAVIETQASSDRIHWSRSDAVNLLTGLESGQCYTLNYYVQATDSNGKTHLLDNDGEGYEIRFVVAGAHYIITGDVNKDGLVNTGDISELYSVILGVDMTNADAADVNNDGVINTGDVSDLYLIILGR